jgi:hypothetical protein
LIGIPNDARRRVLRDGLLAAVAAAALLTMPSVASAASNLSSVVLARTFPGLAAAPPGVRNGPINQSNLSLVTGGNSAAEQQFAQLLASGNVSGYIRAWFHQPTNGDGVVITAIQFPDSLSATQFVNGQSDSVPQGAAPIDVSNIQGATGFSVQTSASGEPLTEHIVTFAKENTAILVVVVTRSGDLTAQDTASLAGRQWANVPTPTNWGLIVRLVLLIGGIVVPIVIVLLARRRRYPAAFATRQLPAPAPPWAPPVHGQTS